MPTKKTASKSASKRKSSSGSDPKSKRVVHDKMETVMHEFKEHQLESSSGDKVKNPKQAIAIGLSEARRSGADIPPNPNQKKSGSKSKATKRPPVGKADSKKKAAAKTASTKKRSATRTRYSAPDW